MNRSAAEESNCSNVADIYVPIPGSLCVANLPTLLDLLQAVIYFVTSQIWPITFKLLLCLHQDVCYERIKTHGVSSY